MRLALQTAALRHNQKEANVANRMLRIAFPFVLLLPLVACQGQCGSEKGSSDPKPTVATATTEENAPTVYQAPFSNPSLCLQGENLPEFIGKLNAGLPTGIPELDSEIRYARREHIEIFGCGEGSIPTTIGFDETVLWDSGVWIELGPPMTAQITFGGREHLTPKRLIHETAVILMLFRSRLSSSHEIGHAPSF